MVISDFPADNSGSPEIYTVKEDCHSISIREKDRTIATLASYNVYFPGNSGYRPCEQGEEYVWNPGRLIRFGETIKIETVNVASATFSIQENA